MIREDAGMSTARFCELIDMPERTWRRWQAEAREGGRDHSREAKGPWPQPARAAVRDAVVAEARAHPDWGHRRIWAAVRPAHQVSPATVLRLLRDEAGVSR